MERRKALLFLMVLVGPAMLAGCNVKDWYNQEGYVRIGIDVQPGTNTSIEQFKSIRAAVYGVSLKQASTVDAKHFTYGAEPLIIDLVTALKEGGRIPLTEFKTNLRPTQSVAIRLAVFDAIDAAGNSMTVCRLKDTPEKFPCFYQPDNAALCYGCLNDERPFAPPRGGEVDVGFPIAVKFAARGRVTQYYLEANPSLIRIDNSR